MRAPSNRRHLLLLLAIGVPCVCLIALGITLIRNSRELALRRAEEDRGRRVAQVGGELLASLERIKLQEAGHLATAGGESASLNPHHPDVAMIGWIRDGHLLLPWDADPGVQRFRQMLSGTAYAEAVAQGERQEVVSQQFPTALSFYQRAEKLATDASERDWAKLLRARTTVKMNCACTADARQLLQSLLESRTVDDQGVPLGQYAASQLLDSGLDHKSVLDMLDAVATQRRWISPASLFLQLTLLRRLNRDAPDPIERGRAAELSKQLTPAVKDIERGIALQRDLPIVLPAAGVRDAATSAVWRLYGDGSWLVSDSAPIAGLPEFLIAIRAEPTFAALNHATPLSTATTGALTFSTRGSTGQPVGPEFPGLRVHFDKAEHDETVAGWPLQRAFYGLALVSVVGLTLFVGFVYWRDVRRELQIAHLRSQFVASVSHELRTPLTAIRMFAETLQMERPLGPSARAEYLNTIVCESERLTRLITNVLDFSRIERGQKVYRLGPASIATVVRAAANALQYPLTQQGFDLRVELADDIPMVRVDEDAIQQAVLNLLTNAMKYSRDRREIDLRVAGVDGQAVIEVRDYGLGIPLHEQSRIFDRFYRVPVPENTRIPGAGLGLALVDHIVKGHGGSVKVHSAPGEGSTFAIHLPLEPAA